MSRTQYQYSLEDRRCRRAGRLGPTICRTSCDHLPELRDVASDQQTAGLAGHARDRPRHGIASWGSRRRCIDDALYDAFGQRQVSTMYTSAEPIPRGAGGGTAVSAESRDSRKTFTYALTAGAMVPLSAFTHFEPGTTALAINHQGQFPAVTALVQPCCRGPSLGDAVQAIETAERDIGLPASIQAGFQGTAQAFQASLANEPLLILAALVTVYIVLGVLYESYIHPITILSTLPSAGVGAILALLLCRTDLSVIALIGIILLIGIVKKNAIMMIDFALEAERQEGRAPEAAIYEACLLRFPSDHDDDDGGAVGQVAVGAGDGSGLGVAAAAGHHDCRWFTFQPTADPLHDSGRLPIPGPVASLVRALARSKRNGGDSWSRKHRRSGKADHEVGGRT